jgi:NAD(P)-dependent dehydrogenase (short-subunit alcohol dehydrogenase family)
MSQEFGDQVAVVVGAASGIGRATAEAFKRGGATVCRLDKDLNVHTSADHQASSTYQVDATDFGLLQTIANQIQQSHQSIDHVVVSIGMPTGTFGFPFWNLDPSDWSRVVNVNLVAPVNVAHAFVPHMLSGRRGTICFVASVAGQIGSQSDPPYSASKAGLINFSQCAAKDLAAYNIRVNAVSPGMVKTPMNRQVWQAWRDSSSENALTYEDWADSKIKHVSPLGRWQTSEDVASAICFLASESAKNITGQTLNVDGGQVMHS